MYHIKNDKRSERSSMLIYEALTSLMKEQKFDDIKITELVSRAQVSRATFYRNFDSLIDVLIYISDNTFTRLLDYLIKHHKNNPVKRSSEFIKPFLYYFDNNTIIVKQLIQAKREHILTDSLVKMFDNIQPQFENVANEANDTWDYFIAIRTGITINILIQWIKNDKNIRPDVLSTLLSEQLKNSFSVDSLI